MTFMNTPTHAWQSSCLPCPISSSQCYSTKRNGISGNENGITECERASIAPLGNGSLGTNEVTCMAAFAKEVKA